MKKIVFSIIFSLVLGEDRIYYFSDVAMGRVTIGGLENEFIIPPTWPGGHNLTDISLDNSKILYITEGNYQEIVMLDVESMDTLMTDLNTEGCLECENYFPEYALFTNNDNEIIFVEDENLYKYSLSDSSVTILIEDEDDWGDGINRKIAQSPDKTKLAYLSKDSNITQLRVFDLLNNEISVIDNFINLNNDCNENNTYWGTGDYLYYTSCITDELSSLFKIHISNGEPAQLLESDIYFIFSTSKQSQLEKLVYTKNSWNSESYRIIELSSHEIINPENMSGIYEGSQIYLNYQAWSPDHSKVALSGIRASGGLGGVIFEAYPVIFIYDLVMDSIESSIYVANGNAVGGDYFIPSFWVQDNSGGFITIEDIEGRWISEMYPNTMYELINGVRLTYYCSADVCDTTYWNSLDSTDALPIQNPYTLINDTLTIDTFSGSIFEEQITILCNGKVIDFNSQQSNWYRIGTDLDECGDYDGQQLDISNLINIPDNLALHQNYPNPFNPITSLRYDLPNDDFVNITIYDMMGRVVKTLANGSQTAGFKSVQWNATNDRNEPVSAGLYLYTIQAGEFRQTKKMVLLK